MPNALVVENLTHRYGERLALNGVSFSVGQGEVFGLVGPNGGGKSTSFQIISTLMKPTSGLVQIFGTDSLKDPNAVRRKIGVVFQSPALDKKLKVGENLRHQGRLYGLGGRTLEDRCQEMLKQLDLADRVKDFVEKLSGGLKRRLEIAKGLLHQPALLILDEPTTGLDPLARRELWTYLLHLRDKVGMTILVTTHLLDEAENCNQVVFLDQGKVVAAGSPATLKQALGGDIICVRGRKAQELKEAIENRFRVAATLVDGEIRLERNSGAEFIPELVSAFPNQIDSVSVGKPTLEDLFIQKTGRRLGQMPEARA